MKKVFGAILTLIFLVAMIAPAQEIQGNTELDWNLTTAGLSLASDSVITGTKYSKTLTLFAKGDKQGDAINYLKGAQLFVFGRQANDSVKAAVYLQAGLITGGTEGKTFGSFLLTDSLLSTKKVFRVDLTNYLLCREIRLKVVAVSGNGVSPSWSARFSGQGILEKSSKEKAAPTH